MFRLIYFARRGSAHLIKKYPNGLGNRMERFDEWTKTWNDPNITCYYDYFYNLENPKFQAGIPDSASSKNDLAQAISRYRPAIGQLNESLDVNENRFGDDHLLSTDVTSLSFRKFVKQGISKDTRNDLHRFFFWFCAAVVTTSIGFYRGVIKEDHKQQVVYLQPDPTFYRYNVNLLEGQVKAFIEKINTINNHSLQELKASRERALQRQKNRQNKTHNAQKTQKKK